MAGQLSRMKGRRRRGPAAWMAWAKSSLPVPDSPVIKTGRLLLAARAASALRRAVAGLVPMMLPSV